MRSFIAIELPEKVQSALAELQGELKKCGADVRWVKPENIHLTLKFLGYIEEKDIDRIVEKVCGACNKYPAFNLAISGVGVFPHVRAPRVLWVGIDSNEMLEGLQSEIEAGMASLGFERENRNFVPHLTIGRFKSSRGRRTLLDKVELYKDGKYGIIDVRAVSLMRSDLSPSGAKYTRIAEISLGGSET